jgi:hypothetical protein
VIVAGIDTLIRGAVGSLAKDKITSQLTPTQMELASFLLNPQYYMAEKGINKIADILGYGSDFKTMQSDAKSNNQYYKEIMRDALGNVLPESIGNIIRSNPKISEADQTPAGEYMAWDPATQSWTTQGSPSPVSTGTSDAFDDFLRNLNAGDTQTVGPLEEYDQKRLDSEYDFQTTLSDFQPGLSNNTDDLGEVTVVDQKSADTGGDLSYTDMIDILNSAANSGASRGLGVPVTESLAPVGSVYDASIGANTPITESLAPVSYTFDVNTGTVVPATDISSLAPVGSTYDPNLGMNVPVTDTTSLAPTGSNFDPNLGMNVPATESFTPIDFGGTMDYSAVLDNDYGDFGGGGSKGNIEDYSYSQYRYGGQIHRGRR